MNEQALKERIKYIARSEGRVFNQIWRILILERLLVRLSHSSYSEQFIFKGGLLLSYGVVAYKEQYLKLEKQISGQKQWF